MRKPVVEKITPKIALQLLEGNTVNRPISDSTVNDYAHLMKMGMWILSPDPICIGKNGEIYNGQHRLWAIIACGMSQSFWVHRECDAEVIKVIDSGKSRSLGDRVNLTGNVMTGRHLAIVKGFYTLPGTHERIGWTPDLVEVAEKKARAHLVFAELAMITKDQRQRLACSAFVVAMARAHMEEISEEELRGFAKVMIEAGPSGVRSDEVDSYVRRLRDKVLADTVGPVQKKYQAEYYLMLAKAIRNFLDGSAPSKIVKTNGDPFPLRKIYRALVVPAIVQKADESFRQKQKELLAAE